MLELELELLELALYKFTYLLTYLLVDCGLSMGGVVQARRSQWR